MKTVINSKPPNPIAIATVSASTLELRFESGIDWLSRASNEAAAAMPASFAWPATRREKGHSVGCSGPDNASFPACITNNSLQLADGFVVPDVLDCNACGNRLSDPDGLDETPVRFEKHGAWSREFFRNNGIQEACGDPALYDETTEWRLRRQLDIVMDRLFLSPVISGEHFDIAHCGRAAPLGAGAQRGLTGEGSCPRRIVNGSGGERGPMSGLPLTADRTRAVL
jgi:hypothetical protein